MSSHYYFNLANGEDLIRDLDGIELSDIHAALTYAMKTIAELRAEDPSTATEWQDWRLEIMDSSGQTVQIIPLDDPDWMFPSQH